MSSTSIPEGFSPYRCDHTFNDVVAPLYFKLENGIPIIGMLVEEKHCNFGGFAHGGCLMTLLDIALSGAVCNVLGQYTSTPTVNFSFDFIAAAKPGDWIYVDILSTDLTRTMGFVNAMIQGPNGNVVRASGSFKLPKNINDYAGMPADEYHQWRASKDE